MVASAKAQHEVDKAQLAAVRAESKANFQENRGCNTFSWAKADAKRRWEDAHMSREAREGKARQEREAKIVAAESRIAAANERYEKAKGKDTP